MDKPDKNERISVTIPTRDLAPHVIAPVASSKSIWFVIVSLLAVFLVWRACTKPPEFADASAFKLAKGKPSVVAALWATKAADGSDTSWLPSGFSGGELILKQDREFGLYDITISTPDLRDTDDAATALRIYDELKQALSRRYGTASAEEYNLYSQHTPLGRCLANLHVSSARPSCQWTAMWSPPDGSSLFIEITKEKRVQVRNYLYSPNGSTMRPTIETRIIK